MTTTKTYYLNKHGEKVLLEYDSNASPRYDLYSRDEDIKEVTEMANLNPDSLYGHPWITSVHTGLKWATGLIDAYGRGT